jgi:hypothetical protein
MLLLPTQDDGKSVLFSNRSPVEASPSPLSSRPERSVVERLSGLSRVREWVGCGKDVD